MVVGGGFGGLSAARALARAGGSVTLIDRNNFHLFQPLSYQVATGALSPGEIAVPLRRVLAPFPRARVLLAEVSGFDLHERLVHCRPMAPAAEPFSEPYDVLVVAGGSSYSYFGHEHWRPYALEVKSLQSALRVRSRLLAAFEAAEIAREHAEQRRLLTFAVIGAGPTGVEMAGQIAELAHEVLPGELRRARSRQADVVLVESAARVLPAFPPPLSLHAERSLQALGVRLATQHTVVEIARGLLRLRQRDGTEQTLEAETIIWAAGVSASPLAGALAAAAGGELDRSGRLAVEADLTLPGHPEVFAIGDMVRLRSTSGGTATPLPGLAPVAMQEGRYVAALIAARSSGRGQPATFRYRDKGTLATIGRARAVAQLGRLRLWGFPAWAIWLTVHIFYLIGFENRLIVLTRWAHSFFTRGRGARLITEEAGGPREGPVARPPHDSADRR
ncbi:MAG TPA: NAD(P)/FAD-dependent oxidoreductase [Solirubrobacteraceae bacterium]|nr:NAD(P)/FAD-dependent oxidoreductase [Solirubrobacteraceae bacterium]